MTPRDATRRLFLRAVLLSEHLVLLAAGSYSLWTREEWKALAIGRAGGTLMLALCLAVSFLISMLLSAAALWWRLPVWVATLAGGVLGPLVVGSALLLAFNLL